jgi:hypothetical protein
MRDDLASCVQANRRDGGLDLAGFRRGNRVDRDVGALHCAGHPDAGHGLVDAAEHHDAAACGSDEVLALGDLPGVDTPGADDGEQDEQRR